MATGVPATTPGLQVSDAPAGVRRKPGRKPGEPVDPLKRDEQAKIKLSTIYSKSQELQQEVDGVHLSIHAWQSVQKDGTRQMRYSLNGHAGLKSLVSVHDTQSGRWMLNEVWYQAVAAALFAAPTAEVQSLKALMECKHTREKLIKAIIPFVGERVRAENPGCKYQAKFYKHVDRPQWWPPALEWGSQALHKANLDSLVPLKERLLAWKLDLLENGRNRATASGTAAAVPAALAMPVARPANAAPSEEAGPGSPATWEAGTSTEDYEASEEPQPHASWRDATAEPHGVHGSTGLHTEAASIPRDAAPTSSASVACVGAPALPPAPAPTGEALPRRGHKRQRDSGPGRGRGRGRQRHAGQGRPPAEGGAATRTSSLQGQEEEQQRQELVAAQLQSEQGQRGQLQRQQEQEQQQQRRAMLQAQGPEEEEQLRQEPLRPQVQEEPEQWRRRQEPAAATSEDLQQLLQSPPLVQAVQRLQQEQQLSTEQLQHVLQNPEFVNALRQCVRHAGSQFTCTK